MNPIEHYSVGVLIRIQIVRMTDAMTRPLWWSLWGVSCAMTNLCAWLERRRRAWNRMMLPEVADELWPERNDG